MKRRRRTLSEIADALRREGLHVELSQSDYMFMLDMSDSMREWLLRHKARRETESISASPPSPSPTR